MTIEVLKNSFVSFDEAKTYFDERFASSIWENSTDKDKEKALITATKKINNLCFIGYKKDIKQSLEFPRIYSKTFPYTYSVPDIPQDIKDATCEEAISLLEYVNLNGESSMNDPTFSMQSFKLGDVSITNTASSGSGGATSPAKKQILSDIAIHLVSKWLQKGFNIPNPIYYETN